MRPLRSTAAIATIHPTLSHAADTVGYTTVSAERANDAARNLKFRMKVPMRRRDATKTRHAMTYKGIALMLAASIASPALANEMDQMANNLETSCSNHFGKRPNKPSNDSRKFCSCFAAAFTSGISLRDLDAAGGIVTPEIQEQFEQAANICSYDIPPSVVQSGRAWIGQTN